MSRLLTLPPEIFDMVMEEVAGNRRWPLGNGSYGIEQEEASRVGNLLRQRLVHSRFREALDKYIFQEFMYALNASGSIKASEPTYNLLNAPTAAAHTRALHVCMEVHEPLEQIDISLEKLFAVLENVSSVLRYLALEPSLCNTEPLFLLDCGGPTNFAALRQVTLRGVSAVSLLPYILQDAPMLDSVDLIGSVRSEPYEEILGHFMTSPEASKCMSKPMRAFKSLKVYEFGSTWLQAYLSVFKPVASVVSILSGHIIVWEGNFRQQVAAVAYLPSYKAFETIYVRQVEGFNSISFLQEGLQQRRTFFEGLRQIWESFAVDILLLMPKRGWEERLAEVLQAEVDESDGDRENGFEPLSEIDYELRVNKWGKIAELMWR